MNLSPQDVIPLIWKLAVALVAVVPILSVIGVWLLARFTNVFDAYAGERAKLQVQFDNVAKLVQQTETLTTTVETIKHQLSEELWGKQQRWLKQLETYVYVIEKLEHFRSALVELTHFLQSAGEYHGTDETIVSRIQADKERVLLQYNQAIASWSHSRALAYVSCSAEAVALLEALKMPTLYNTINLQPLRDAHQQLKDITFRFALVARHELGYSPIRVETAE